MSDFPKECDSCRAPMSISEDTRTLDCPQCGPRFHLRPPCPYESDVIAEAQKHLSSIEDATNHLARPVREALLWLLEALLWLLEEQWLSSSGHKVTVKVGCDSHRDAAACAICGKKVAKDVAVLHLEVRDRWRDSHTVLNVCRSHVDERVWSGDMDVLRNQSLKLGMD
jgi:DNA-directed RNA polymerase subunit RPC12/RpoP